MGQHGIRTQIKILEDLVDTSDGAALDVRVDSLETDVGDLDTSVAALDTAVTTTIPADIATAKAEATADALAVVAISGVAPDTSGIVDAPTKDAIDDIILILKDVGIYA